MLTDIGKIELTKILLYSFGKCQFTEEELTEDFWSKLYITASDFFSADGKGYNLDFFWSDSVRDWLLEEKTEWLKQNETALG